MWAENNIPYNINLGLFVFFQHSRECDMGSPNVELHSIPSGKNMILAEVSACIFVGEAEKPGCGSLHTPDDYHGTFWQWKPADRNATA